VDFAGRAAAACEEYIFLDTLSYLAASGRMSKTGAVFGDMLSLKPVVSPLPEGAKKVGMVRNRKDQIAFALKKLDTCADSGDHPLVMLEYTDNQSWVAGEIAPLVQNRLPDAKIIIHPLSLTTGVHTGPGTWGIAFLPVTS
jgi:fatty acid-binding protein DegV